MATQEPIALPAGCKEIPSFPGYCVGLDNTVWTIKAKGGKDKGPGRRAKAWRRMKTRLFKGYYFVMLNRDGKRCPKGVHALILEAFVGPCPEGMECCHHPDPTRTNNSLDNIRWDTPAENTKDRHRDRPPATEKRCHTCNVVKPIGEFYKDKRVVDGRKSQCKPCHIRTTNEARSRRES